MIRVIDAGIIKISTDKHMNEYKRLFASTVILAQILFVGAFGAVAVANAQEIVDFKQCSNENSTLGDCKWINGIIQQSNSKYYEGMSVPQRTVFANIGTTSGNVHTLNFSHQASKAGIHAYDWLTSYDQAIASAASEGVAFTDLNGQACDPSIGPPGSLGATCTALKTGSFFLDVSVPDDAFVSADGSTQDRINAYETANGNRTIRIYGNAAIVSASLTLAHSVANFGDTGDSDINYVLTWTSASTQVLIEMGGHLAVSGDGAGMSWGAGNGSGQINGGPYHFNLKLLDGGSLGSQDNQIKGADILVPDNQAPSLTLNKIVVNDEDGNTPESAWTLSASGPTPLSGPGASGDADVVSGAGFSAGTYILSESAGPAGYTPSAWVCVGGGVQSGSSITLGLGESAVCTITNNDSNILPVITVDKTANVSSVNEPGGPVTYTFTVTNVSSVDAVTITSLSDDTFGTLSGDADCQVGTIIPVGGFCTFDYTATILGNGNTSHTNVFTAHAVDNEGSDATDSDDATVNFLDVLPTVALVKSVDSAALPEPGGTFTYTVTITNTSVEDVEIVSLTDDNALSPECLALIGTTLVPGQTVSCVYLVDHTDAGTYPNTASVTVEDDENNSVSDEDSQTVKVVGANITIDPLTATNDINSPHTFTVTVMKNDGGAWIVAAGEHVGFTLTDADGAVSVLDTAASTCDNVGANTDASGQCIIVLNSATPGTISIHAMVDVAFGSTIVHRETDGTNSSSVDAVKTYVAGSLEVTKNLVLGGYTLPVNGSFSLIVTGPSYPSGTPLNFIVTNGVVSGTQTLENLIPGTYTVTETDPGLAWTVSGEGNTNVEAGVQGTASVTNTLKQPHTTISITADVYETLPGENVLLTVSDTNDGEVPLTGNTVVLTYGLNTIVLDENSPNFSGDADNDGVMDPGETWVWTLEFLISANTTFSVAGHGDDLLGNDISPDTGYASEADSIVIRVIGTTRTIGFWQTHTDFTTSVFANQLGGTMLVGDGATHKGPVETVEKIFGGFYAPIAKTTAGIKRTQIDQARIALLQQLLAAKLNCAAFGCSAAVQGQIALADTAYAGTNKNTIMSFVSVLDAFNGSGDGNAIPALLPPTGKATPALSKSLANLPFWDNP